MSIRVSHAHGEHIAVAAPDGTEILRYVYRPDPDAFEAASPTPTRCAPSPDAP